MAKSNAVKRLERILFDTSPEEYGPKLTRLSAKDQAHILGRIERSENAQVTRREILRLDKERLARNRAKRQKLPTIEELRAKAYARLRQMLNGKPKTQARGVSLMNKDQLNIALTADADTLRMKAAEYPDIEVEMNVFWYK
jgi:hypothetical protein